jgi:hypothetical protein
MPDAEVLITHTLYSLFSFAVREEEPGNAIADRFIVRGHLARLSWLLRWSLSCTE